MNDMPKVGELAPDFELRDDEEKAHRLSERRGHFTVVYFYPADDTPGCTKEACSFRDNNAAFRDADAEVWGLSPQGPASKAAFRAKYGLPFSLLADEDHAVANSYGAWGEKVNYGKTYWGILRTSFLVGPDGRVARVWTRVKPENHASEVLAALRGTVRPRLSRHDPHVPQRSASSGPGSGPAALSRSRARTEASPVGGDERSLGRHHNSHPQDAESDSRHHLGGSLRRPLRPVTIDLNPQQAGHPQ